MNRFIKDNWVKALRSGHYDQIGGNLKGDSGFCCLGVLACVMGKEEELTTLQTSVIPPDPDKNYGGSLLDCSVSGLEHVEETD